jgi:DNA segregation ATPase FtsK/SpoIIIE, S-DNA-T family
MNRLPDAHRGIELEAPSLPLGQRREVMAFVGVTLAMLSTLALWSYDDAGKENLVGVVGAAASALSTRVLGALAWSVPFEFAALSVRMFCDRPAWFGEGSWKNGLAIVSPVVSVSALVTLGWPGLQVYGEPAGGLLGVIAAELMVSSVGAVGTWVLGVGIVATSIAARTTWRVRDAVLSTREEPVVDEARGAKRAKAPAAVLGQAVAAAPRPPVRIIVPTSSRTLRQPARAGTYEGRAFALPPTSLLEQSRSDQVQVNRREIECQADALLDKLAAHGVEGRVEEVHAGPVVTTYELAPAHGAKLSKIVGLADDVAMGLAAQAVRVLAPIPGKARVGFELPNRERQTVVLRPLLESREWHAELGTLPLALGVSASGQPVFADLAEMPHLLVAGATGAGKSVGLNAMLASLLFRFAPDQVRLVVLDLKRVEFGVYADIPHLLVPVVTEVELAAHALQWAVTEMERRYELLTQAGARNLASYNERSGGQKLPYIVVVVDEVADLLMSAPKSIEAAIGRLAQKARAAGIHLILATQRPSVDVITGTIKANFPTRLAFKVSQREDSRTILGVGGAERLLGEGDMLFLAPGTTLPQRVHGAFIGEDEVLVLCDYLRAQGKPVYDASLLHARDEASASPSGAMRTPAGEVQPPAEDDLYDRAAALVAAAGRCSVSELQRKLGIGYNRATRLVERMESEGLVGRQAPYPRRDAGRPRRSDSSASLN